MKKILFLFLSMASLSMTAQGVGIGTTTPNGSSILDVESTTKGFLPPRMNKVQMNAITTAPANTAPATGLIVYCTNCSPAGLRVYNGSAWAELGSSSSSTVSANCNANGFVGTYVSGVAVSGASFSVTVTNNSFSTAVINFVTGDLVLSGISGLMVGTPTGSPALSSGNATLVAGQSVVVTYPITGTPGATGTLTGTWTKLSLNCVKTKIIGLGDATLSLPAGASVVSICQGAGCSQVSIQGVVDNDTNKKIVNVAYTGGLGSYDGYTSGWISGTGEGGDTNSFRISYPPGTFNASGTIPVTIEVGGDGTFNALKIAPGSSQLIATMPLNVNGDYRGDVTLKIVTCGAPTSTGGFLVFKCHNLGADESADPFTPSWQLNGAYFQWGRKPTDSNNDGYKTKLSSGSIGFAAAPTGPGPGAGETNEAAVGGWNNASAATNGAWNLTEESPAKTAHDPCPSGYRVPTQNEWESIYTSVTGNWSNVGGATWTASPTNYSIGKNVNNSLYLPASGYRTSDGSLASRGSRGSYWSSTELGTNNAYYLIFGTGSVNPASSYDRLGSFSVRCVAE